MSPEKQNPPEAGMIKFVENELLNAYFAGLIDGEGTVDVYPYKKGKYSRPVIKLNMTCEKTVRRIHAHFGGSVMSKKVPDGCKPQWHWIVTFCKAVRVAEQIRPYLITKATLADKLLLTPPVKKRIGRPRKNPPQ